MMGRTVLHSIWIPLLLACSNPGEIKFKQYFLKGEQLYSQNCANCHQKDGRGLGALYPPLDSADYLTSFPDSVLCIIRKGRQGPMVVNGITYNQPMPAFPALTDLEIAQIATYIHNSWSNRAEITDVKDASAILDRCD